MLPLSLVSPRLPFHQGNPLDSATSVPAPILKRFVTSVSRGVTSCPPVAPSNSEFVILEGVTVAPAPSADF